MTVVSYPCFLSSIMEHGMLLIQATDTFLEDYKRVTMDELPEEDFPLSMFLWVRLHGRRCACMAAWTGNCTHCS